MDDKGAQPPNTGIDETLKKDLAAAKKRRAKSGAALAARLRRRRKRRVSYAVISVCLLLVVFGTGVYNVYVTINTAISGAETEAGELPDEFKSSEEETLQGIINFLVCGIDYSDDDGGDPNSFTASTTTDTIGNTDMILYVRYDTSNNDVTILQLPRDIYVGDELETGGYGKINSLYKYAPDTNNRMAALAEVVYQQFGLPIDFYITLDMDAVKEIIDIKGSLKVYVPVDVDNPETGDLIPAGWRHFSGEETEFYLRNRYSTTYSGQGDIMRLQMQQYFYSAIYREFKSLGTQDLVMWMAVLLYRAKTDMDVLKLGNIAQNALSLEGSDITFIRPAVGGTMYNGQFVLSVQDEEYLHILNTYFRPEDGRYTLDDLDIHMLEYDDEYGINETSIRSMSDIQEEETEEAAVAAEQPQDAAA